MTTSPMTQGLTQLKPESTLGSDAAAAAAGATPAIDIHVSLPSVTPAAPAAHLASTEEVPLSSQSGEEKRTNGFPSPPADAVITHNVQSEEDQVQKEDGEVEVEGQKNRHGNGGEDEEELEDERGNFGREEKRDSVIELIDNDLLVVTLGGDSAATDDGAGSAGFDLNNDQGTCIYE